MRKHPLLPIFLIVLVDVLALTIILPLLPFYTEHFGGTPQVVGLLVATYAACQLVAGPPLGNLSDRVGRKPVLVVSQMGTFVGLLVLAFADRFSASTGLALLFLGRGIDGITAGNLSIAQAYISDVTAPEKRAASFGVIGIAFGVGFLLGPALSGYFSQFSYALPILIAAGLSLTSIAATALLLPNAHEAEELKARVHAESLADGAVEEAPPPAGRRLGLLDWGGYLEYFRRPGLARLLLQFFLFTLSFSFFTSGFALFAERRFTWNGHGFRTREVGYVFAYVGFLGIILQGGMIKPLVKRFGEAKLVVFSFFVAAIAYGLLGAIHGVAMLLAIATLSSIGTGLLRPGLTSLVTRAVGRHEQGVVLGLTQSLQSISAIVAPLVGTFLIDHAISHEITNPLPHDVDHPEFLVAWALLAAAPMLVGFLSTLLPAPAPRTA